MTRADVAGTAAMYRGVAPLVLLDQVKNTAAWALEGPVDTPSTRWRAALRAGASIAGDDPGERASDRLRVPYLELLLAAHFATVATFVPTDVDSHIRHHAWQRARSPADLGVLVAVLDGTDAWDAREVSARVIAVPGVGDVSGHDGEWLGVRAGALERALALGAHDLAESLSARIDQELSREARAFAAVADVKGRETDALRLATTLAHNVGDLSRVVAEWDVPSTNTRAEALRQRYVGLGHAEGPGDPTAARHGGWLALAGHVNKTAGMATENHRFLSLRAARGLRSARSVLLPVGPFFDGWGETLGRHPALTDGGQLGSPGALAAVVAALAEGHVSDPGQQGYLRALAGIQRVHRGGLAALAGEVPARLRKVLTTGAVRDAAGVDPVRFEARMVNRYRTARAAWR